jgi:type VI secretion system FHA domain protein
MGEFEVQVLFAERRRATADKKSRIELPAGDDGATPIMPEELPPPEPGIFDEPTFVGGDEPTYMGPAVRPPPAPKAPAPPVVETPKPLVEPAATRAPAPKSAAAAASLQDAARIFLDGAGLPEKDLTAEQSEKLLRESGAILRAAVEGLMTLLLARGEMRKEFEAQERTMVAAPDNNPLELMGGAQEAMDFLFDPAERREGFLQPVQAIADAAEDLRAHELALMAGMRGAILSAVRRFDAQVLEKALGKPPGGFSFGGRKAKMWDLFLAYQQKLSQEAQEDFSKVFGRDFMAAYEAQLRRLKKR